METSLTNFNKVFQELLISALWNQWEKLGVAIWTDREASWGWLIDLEALVFATFLLREEERRLYNVMREWIGSNRRYLHTVRLRRIWRQYIDYLKQMKIPAPDHEEILKVFSPARRLRAQEILTTPDWEDPSLLWLKIRALLGTSARSDILTYFFYHSLGTTFAISRDMFLDQKSVHDILRTWESVGWVRRFGQRRGYTFSSVFRNRIMSIFGISQVPPWLNAGRVFIGMFLVKGAFQRFAEHQNEYLLSSHFRDVFPLLHELWEHTGVTMPLPSSFPGKSYIHVFLSALLDAWKQIGHPTGETHKRPREGVTNTPKPYTGGEIMGFTEQDMYGPAYRTLRRRYPAGKGWEVYFQEDWGGYRPDFVLERRDFWGTVHRVVAEVKAECKITKAHIRQLNAYTRALAGGNAVIDEKILIVPAGSDTSIVPEDIRVIYLRGFKCAEV